MNSARGAREKFLSVTPKFLSATYIFWLLGYFGYCIAICWLFIVVLRILGVAPTVGKKGVALIVGEKTSLISPLCMGQIIRIKAVMQGHFHCLDLRLGNKCYFLVTSLTLRENATAAVLAKLKTRPKVRFLSHKPNLLCK